MKEIRQIVEAVSPEDEPILIEDDDEEMTMKRFDSESPYFNQVIRPMLSPGHENELSSWLREFGLIRTVQKCKNAGTNDTCSTMVWSSSRVKDRYQWVCKACKSRRSIRDGSIFDKAKCSFTIGIRIILGWCKGYDMEYLANILGAKKTAVEGMYKKLTHIAEQYMLRNIEEWQIGGYGKLILIDTYPEGSANPDFVRNNCNPLFMLCLSEVGTFPQKSWLEKLNNHKQNITFLKKQILSIIQRIVRPGSTLIIPARSVLGFLEEIAPLRIVYPTIINTDMLSRHDNEKYNLKAILDIIWKNVQIKCEETQYYSLGNIQDHITGNLWRMRYGNSNFENLIYQIAS